MTSDEIEVLKAQQKLRQQFEKDCKAKDWDPSDVFYSDIEFCVKPGEPGTYWPSTLPSKAEQPFVQKHREHHGNVDSIRQRPVIERVVLRPRRPNTN